MELHLQCQGQGLMIWREGKRIIFVVETERERFVPWVIKRMTYFQNRETRDQVLSDALWSTLFAQSDNELRDKQKVVFDTGQVFSLASACPDTRDAVKFCTENNQIEHVVVFESPWPQDCGWRVQRALKSLPAHVPKADISIWEPQLLNPEKRVVLRQYLATQMALRYALVGHRLDFCNNWLVRALRRSYLRTTPTALRMLIDSYREGQVIIDTSVFKPHAQDRDLLYTLGLIWKKVTW
jgi:dipeptidyl aminopeptidase/acylaminoacyl peptidase